MKQLPERRQQHQLFHDSIEEAIREVVRALGGSKKVAPRLWADKDPDAANRRLLDCLNEEREARLAPYQLMQLIAWGREVECHAIMRFLASETGYECTPTNPLNEVEKLQREFNESVELLKNLATRIERITPKVQR